MNKVICPKCKNKVTQFLPIGHLNGDTSWECETCGFHFKTSEKKENELLKEYEVKNIYYKKGGEEIEYRATFLTDKKYFVKCTLEIIKYDGCDDDIFISSCRDFTTYTKTSEVKAREGDVFDLFEGQKLALDNCFAKYKTINLDEMERERKKFIKHVDYARDGMVYKIKKATNKRS